MMGMRFAHLTDLHLPAPAPPGGLDLLGKRALGYLSWRGKRRWRHALWALETLVEDCRRQRCDIDIITGDLVNISLPSEFVAARKWLIEHFDSERTLVAPGNHDAYVRLPWADGLGQLSAFMQGARHDDPAPRPPHGEADFPFVRVLGEVCFIILSSAAPTAPGLATGRLGRAQLARLRRELTAAAAAGLCRVIALHHPVAKGVVSRRKALDDGPALALAGRVPVKVTDEGGSIRPGDLLVAAPTAGHAMRAPDQPRPGSVIGKALGRLGTGTGVVEMLVMLR